MSWLKESAKFAAEQKARDLKSTAAEIYARPHHQRRARVEALPESYRWLVWMYMDQMSQAAQRENRKRVAERMNPNGVKAR